MIAIIGAIFSRNYNKHSSDLWFAFRRTDYGWTT